MKQQLNMPRHTSVNLDDACKQVCCIKNKAAALRVQLGALQRHTIHMV